MRNASGHRCKVKMSGSQKKVNKKTSNISPIKRVAKKFLEVSRSVHTRRQVAATLRGDRSLHVYRSGD